VAQIEERARACLVVLGEKIMKLNLTSRYIAAGVLTALTALPVLNASAEDKMSGGKMSGGSMMSSGKMAGKPMAMSASDKMMMNKMMAKMTASEKKTMMGMSAAEKQVCMKMCRMSGAMMHQSMMNGKMKGKM